MINLHNIAVGDRIYQADSDLVFEVTDKFSALSVGLAESAGPVVSATIVSPSTDAPIAGDYSVDITHGGHHRPADFDHLSS